MLSKDLKKLNDFLNDKHQIISLEGLPSTPSSKKLEEVLIKDINKQYGLGVESFASFLGSAVVAGVTVYGIYLKTKKFFESKDKEEVSETKDIGQGIDDLINKLKKVNHDGEDVTDKIFLKLFHNTATQEPLHPRAFLSYLEHTLKLLKEGEGKVNDYVYSCIQEPYQDGLETHAKAEALVNTVKAYAREVPYGLPFDNSSLYLAKRHIDEAKKGLLNHIPLLDNKVAYFGVSKDVKQLLSDVIDVDEKINVKFTPGISKEEAINNLTGIKRVQFELLKLLNSDNIDHAVQNALLNSHQARENNDDMKDYVESLKEDKQAFAELDLILSVIVLMLMVYPKDIISVLNNQIEKYMAYIKTSFKL